METSIVYWEYTRFRLHVGIMENEMETLIQGFRV